ncbi:bifunctional 2-polyprenyl-6-hydroxyphenol methylase/3-demethylubiquinol 3-O-methyltransferase UbiG [Frankia sp. AgB32]|uniref:class I SAM-dependent methyltransferase n=1 Tax=Frankia sp. AgB32 TaxID=631119 RepID=UPI00200C6904|nr:class I SAM-dependent methyltransferase [Frankia sp. AgB32]MCK9896580.1 class I SAM-dependent methyltransferase [Frankia sp. AgB32]
MEIDLRYRNGGNPDLLELIDIRPGRALDCGCGAGDNARLLRERGWRVTGVTIDTSERAAAGRECEQVELADLAHGLPFAPDGSYQLVLLSHILEHLADPVPLLAEARRVLAPGGRILVALPNVLHYRQRAQFVLGRFEYTDTGLMDATHLRFYTVDSARRLLADGGLRIVAATTTGGLPWWRGREFLPSAWVRAADRRALDRLPNLCAWQSLFLAAPARPAVLAGPAGPAVRAAVVPGPGERREQATSARVPAARDR